MFISDINSVMQSDRNTFLRRHYLIMVSEQKSLNLIKNEQVSKWMTQKEAIPTATIYLCANLNLYAVSRVVFPNFGHPALTSSFTKYKLLKITKFSNNYEWTASFEIVYAFEWWFYFLRSISAASTKCLNLEWRS